ncbi:MAG: FtsX-like permease family protein, partial [Christensenellaceae bacterium]
VMGILLSTFILLLLHNALTGQIRAHVRQIGLMRAVGGNPGQVSQIYLRQIALLFLGGMTAGAALLAGFFQLPRLMKAENLSITLISAIWKIGSWLNLNMGTSAESLIIIFVLSLGYGLLLALIGLLLVRSQLTRILRRPILENIRVL